MIALPHMLYRSRLEHKAWLLAMIDLMVRTEDT